jgi:hypothetical protein
VLALLDPDEDVRANLQGFGERVIKYFLYENGPCRGRMFFERYFESIISAGKLRQADPRIAGIHFRGCWNRNG